MRRPSPAIVVAVLALIAAIAGTAVAAPGGSPSAITKKKVRKVAAKVANQQIDERAPGLSVANAANAANAATAADADKLDGLDSKELTPGTFSETGTNVTLTTSAQPVVSTTLVTHTDATVLATGSVELDADGGGNDAVRCLIRIDDVAGSNYAMDINDPANHENTVTVTGGAPVAAGTHTASLDCSQVADPPNDIHSDEAVITVSAHP